MQDPQLIRQAQQALLALGIPLPRFGADGHLGDETRHALATFARQHQLEAQPIETILQTLMQTIAAQAASAEAAPFLDETLAHPGTQWRPRAQRPWTAITGITLHQTAVLMGEEPRRWHTLNAHFGVTRAGRVLQICPLDRIVWHGNGFNATDIGIEIDGYFEGVEGLRNTLWNPPTDPTRRPLTPTQEQIEATRQLITWLCQTAQANGGAITNIHAHRQSSRDRQSDPGSYLWRELGIWAQRELGLSDGGRAYTLGTGLAIPEAWDPTRKGIRY